MGVSRVKKIFCDLSLKISRFSRLISKDNLILGLKMDIDKLKKYAENAIVAGKLVKAVTAFKNELKDKEQMRDKGMSDYFKTLREPLIEQQKKTDEKQDKVIEQLQKNQKAITSGIQDIMTLNTELPQLAPEDFAGPRELPAPDEKVLMANIDKKFNEEEMEIIKKNKLMAPSELLKLNVGELKDYEKTVEQISKDYGYKFIGPKKRKDENDPEIPGLEKEKETINAYGETVRDVINFQTHYSTPKKGQGLKQPKRHAYKIQDGSYGGLVIDLPRLYNEMKLNVFRGGKLLYSADAVKSLINFIRKRFNPKTKYSINAVKIFNDLNTLSNMPKHRSSGKTRMVGSSVTYYNDPQNLMERMNILIGSMQAGNNSEVVKNDLSQINDELLRINAIDRSLHERFYQKYLK